MKKVAIEAFEDPARPSGGYAVIALRGLTSLADGRTFMLRPLDWSEDEPGFESWPTGPHAPASARLSAEGLELVLGPELTGNPALLAGTAVTIELVGADVGGEFLWPDISPPARPRRTTVIAARAVHAQAAPSAPVLSPPPSIGERTERGGVDNDKASSAPPAMRPEPQPTIRTTARMSVPAPRPDDEIAPESALEPRVGSSRIASRNLLPTSRAGLAAAAVGCVLVVEALAYAVFAPTTPRVANAMPATASARDTLYDALKPADVSPRGQDAHSIDAEKALDKANASLFATSTRDTGEAAFWLRRFLAMTLGEEVHRRLITELGMAYASPSHGAPDYAAAHALWQVAAAFGDASAMCRMAELYETAGGPRDPAEAAKWRARAADTGGCATR